MTGVARLLVSVLLAVVVVACDGETEEGQRATLILTPGERTVTLEVEIADEPTERARGLMGRTELPEDQGMAFLFEEETDGAFWMKDTLIPLSIAFWDAGGRIVAIVDMQPCQVDPCPRYSPGVAYVGAVEVNVGWFERMGVGIGDRVEFRG